MLSSPKCTMCVANGIPLSEFVGGVASLCLQDEGKNVRVKRGDDDK